MAKKITWLLRSSISRLDKFYYHDKSFLKDTKWLGVRAKKYPTDAWIYQEIIYQTRPDIILECGTKFGGSALFLATILDAVHKGKVITIDIQAKPNLPLHPRITYIHGNSVDATVAQQVKTLINPDHRVMVILDSDHHRDHVLREMELYGALVSRSCYLIVEDTNSTVLAEVKNFGPGPDEAVTAYLNTHPEFVVDTSKERYLLTSNPNGYLLKVAETYQQNFLNSLS